MDLLACLTTLRCPSSNMVGAVDDGLNDVAYIVPGLGDAGDRQFGPR